MTNTPVDIDDLLADLDLSAVLEPETSTPPIVPEPSIPEMIEAAPPVVDDRAVFYASLAVDDAEKLRAAAGRISASRRLIGTNMLAIGRELITINSQMPGHFEEWLRLEFSMSRSSAYNYIRAATLFEDVPQVVEALPAATVYKLAAKATPAEIRDTVVREITAGQPVSAEDVEERISEAKAKAAEEKRIQAELKKQKHPPAANDDEPRAKESADSGQEKMTGAQLTAEEANSRGEPAAKSGAAEQQNKDADRRGEEHSEQRALETLASLRRELTADALLALQACANSDASWNALRGILVGDTRPNVAA